MSAAPTTRDAANRPQRRGWLQFSLFSLLLLAVIGCLVGAYLGEQRQRKEVEARLQQKEAQNRQYRIDLGILDDRPNVLTIADPKLIHIRQLPSTQPHMQWRWRLYIPPGRRWRIGVSQGEEWDEASQRFIGSEGGSNFDDTGELTLEAEMSRNLDGKAFVKTRWCNHGGATWIPDAGVAVLLAKGKRTAHIAGDKKQETFAPQGHIDLMRWHVALDANVPLTEVGMLPGHRQPPSSYGFSIHLEETLPSDPMYRISPKAPRKRPPQ